MSRWKPMAQSCAGWARTNKAAVDGLREYVVDARKFLEEQDPRILRIILSGLIDHSESMLRSVGDRIELDAEAFDRIANEKPDSFSDRLHHLFVWPKP